MREDKFKYLEFMEDNFIVISMIHKSEADPSFKK